MSSIVKALPTASWNLLNPVLPKGDNTYDTTLKLYKVGDGQTPWNDLPYNDATPGTGTYVSSVGLSMPSIFVVSGSPVTNTGTLTAALATQTANRVFASPNGATGTPTFRALVPADLGTGGALNRVLTHDGSGGMAWVAPATPTTTIVVGTTPVTSGTVGRVFFEGSGNVVQQHSGLNYDTTNGLIIGGATARGTRLTLINAADTLASKTLVIRNAADSSETFSFTGNGIMNLGVANANSDVITLAGASWFRATSTPATIQFQSVGFGNTITTVQTGSNIFGCSNTFTGAGSAFNHILGYNNTIRANVAYCNIIGNGVDIQANSSRITVIGTRSTSSQRALAGTDLTYIGFCTDTNGIDLSTSIITYFNANNMSHAFRKGGNIALFGEKYTILNQNALPSAFSIRNYMDINATNTLTIHNGTAPSGNIADAIQVYAADITTGNTGLHVWDEAGRIFYAGQYVGMRTNHDLQLAANNTVFATLRTTGAFCVANLAADPAGNNGDIYYNTTTNKFRAFENGAWVNLI